MNNDLEARMKLWGGESKPFTPDTPFEELGVNPPAEYAEAKTLRELTTLIGAEQEKEGTNRMPIDVEDMFTDQWASQLREPITWRPLEDTIDVEEIKRVVETVLPGVQITG